MNTGGMHTILPPQFQELLGRKLPNFLRNAMAKRQKHGKIKGIQRKLQWNCRKTRNPKPKICPDSPPRSTRGCVVIPRDNISEFWHFHGIILPGTHPLLFSGSPVPVLCVPRESCYQRAAVSPSMYHSSSPYFLMNSSAVSQRSS